MAVIAAAAVVIPYGMASGADTPSELRVQLKWYHQAQFAGFYAAIDQGYFADRGVKVITRPNRAEVNPLESLVAGEADVAVASMSQAVMMSTNRRTFVNVAQVFDTADSMLICRVLNGFTSERDLHGRTVAVSDDRAAVVRKIFAAIFPDGGNPRIIPPQPDLAALTSGDADCIWGSKFNEYWRADDAGLEVFTVSPAEYGVVNIEDGLYVESKRLADPGFREQLAALLVGLEEGWSFAASNPSATVQLVLDNDSQLDAFSQRRELEVVLPLLGTRFGYFDVAKYETFDTWGRPLLPADLHQRLWTHDVFNRAQAITGRMGFISPVTRHYIEVVRDTDWYRVLVWFGVFAASFSGALLGARMRYRLWGRILLGMMTALGGGVVRDVLLGGARYPIPLLHDVKTLLVSLLGVGVVSGLLHLPRGERLLLRAHRLNDYADVVGFAILAINGATIALISNASVIWAPICAAITVSGGGLLSDIVCGREHRRFRGEVYDEVAVVGALVLLGFLKFADGHEHRPGQVLGSVAFALSLLLAARYAVLRFRLQYPTWTRRTGSVDGDAVVAVP